MKRNNKIKADFRVYRCLVGCLFADARTHQWEAGYSTLLSSKGHFFSDCNEPFGRVLGNVNDL